MVAIQLAWVPRRVLQPQVSRVCVCLVAHLCLTLGNPMDCSPPLSMGFSRSEYWSGLPFPPSGDLPDPGIKPHLLHLLHCQGNSLPLVPSGKPQFCVCIMLKSMSNTLCVMDKHY